MNSSDATEPSQSLKSLRMYLHDRCGLIRIEQRFEMKCTGRSRTAIVRAYPIRRFLGWEIVTGEQEGLLIQPGVPPAEPGILPIGIGAVLRTG